MISPYFSKDFVGLQPLSGSLKHKNIFGFDIETANNKFYCLAITGKNNYYYYTENKKDFLKELATNKIYRGSYIVATNLMYDLFGTVPIKKALKIFSCIEKAGTLITAKTYASYDNNDFSLYHPSEIKGHRTNKEKSEYYPITFIDTLGHLPASVEYLGKIIGSPKMKSPSYLGKRIPTNKEKPYFKAYNKQDADVSRLFIEFLQNNYNELGASLKMTVASTTLDLFRRKYLLETKKLKKE